MARLWTNRIVEKPMTFTIQNNPDGTITLIPAPGVITEEGTPVNAANLNGLENDLVEHKADNVQQFAEMGYNIYQLYLQNYYDGKYPYKRGLFFDGFIDTNVIDAANSYVILDLINKKIVTKKDDYIIQTSGGGSGTSIGGALANMKKGQTFTIGKSINLESIETYLSPYNSPTDGVMCKLWSTENGLPKNEIMTSPTIISGASMVVNGLKTFMFDIILSSGVYAFTVERTGAITSSNFYNVSFSTSNVYSGGTRINYNGSVWDISSSSDLVFNVNIGSPVQNPAYQSKEQLFSQNVEGAVLYVKSKTIAGCSISAQVAIYTDAEVFAPMVLETTRDLGEGYQEDKFSYSTVTPGNKVKAKITLNRPDITTEYEVNQYGVILGVA